MIDRIEKILEFWFGAFPDAWSLDASKPDMWFVNGAAYDADIFQTFGADYFKATAGELDHWGDTPRGRLALIILLDQFSRHIHRGSAEQFAQDSKAQQLCLEGISMGKPTLAYLDDRVSYVLREVTGSRDIPFVNVRLEEAEAVLAYLLDHPDEARDIGLASRRWMETYLSERRVVEIFEQVYVNLLEDPSLGIESRIIVLIEGYGLLIDLQRFLVPVLCLENGTQVVP